MFLSSSMGRPNIDRYKTRVKTTGSTYISGHKVIANLYALRGRLARNSSRDRRVDAKTFVQDSEHILKLVHTQEVDLVVTGECSPELFVHLLKLVSVARQQIRDARQSRGCGLGTTNDEIMGVRVELPCGNALAKEG